jgi:ABC-type bacteriocin/lantibiotic exporter with double-glycine peptidase domain
MDLQADLFSCGVFAIRNALLALGHSVSEKKIRVHTGTTAEHGTQDHGIKQALERLGYTWEEVSSPDLSQARTQVVEAIAGGAAAILLTKAGQHWVAGIGVNGTGLIVFDSDTTKKNRVTNGVKVWTAKKVAKYWTPYQGNYYALLARKAKRR